MLGKRSIAVRCIVSGVSSSMSGIQAVLAASRYHGQKVMTLGNDLVGELPIIIGLISPSRQGPTRVVAVHIS